MSEPGDPGFTPTTREVMWAYEVHGDSVEFDRWLDQVKADAWDEGYNACNEYQNGYVAVPRRNPYRQAAGDE